MAKLALSTKRLILKRLDYKSAHLVLEYFNRNRVFLSQWEAKKPTDFYTESYMKHLLNTEAMQYCEGKLHKFYIFEKDNEERIIGTIALNEIVRGCFQSCFLGYRLDGDEINKGYMSEATEAVVRYAFEELNLHRIEGNIMPKNKASLKVLEGQGFYNEGLAKDYLLINGRWEDHIHMVKLNKNYKD